MPKKKSTTGSPGPGAPTTPTTAPARPRLSLLERIRSEQTAEFHAPERERLMVSEAGREAYAAARMDLPLHERLRLFERIVEDALQAYAIQGLALSQHESGYAAAERAHHKAVLAPLIAGWRSVAQAIDTLRTGATDPAVPKALELAAGTVRRMVANASEGRASDAAHALDEALELLDRVAVRFASTERTEDATQCRALQRELRERWPASGVLSNVVTKGLRDSMAASEVTQDLHAVVRWFAPVLAQECVNAGLDPSVVRQVGSTMSRAGGGAPHLVKRWPEQRARVQVLGDQAGRPLPPRVGQRIQVKRSIGPQVRPLPAEVTWKDLHRFLREQSRGDGGVEGILPPSPSALRKAAERGRQPWAALKKTRTLAMARHALKALRET